MPDYKVVNATQLDSDMESLADSIRAKAGVAEKLAFPAGMKAAVEGILTGSDPVIQPLSVIANGTYTAPKGVDGYSPVTVNVPSSGGGGALPSVSPKQVNFYDYDGTVLYSYTVEEAAALEEMPPLPEHDGLICQGWNWSLADIKAMGRAVNIGAMYITDDGKTRVYITLHDGRTSPLLGCCPNGTVTVDWGDGTEPDVLTGTSTTSVKWTPNHEYAAPGDYVITLTVDGTMGFYGSSSSNQYSGILRYSSGANAVNRVYQNAVQKVEIGSGVTFIGQYAFGYCYSLASITIPDSVTSIGQYAFYNCYSLASITIPDGVTSIGSSAFQSCYSLASITIPDGVTSIGSSAFYNCYSLASITIPDGVTSIGSSAFSGCYSLASITIPDSVTSIGGSAFYNCYSLASITIPDGVTSIGSSAFQSCYSLASITIPDSVTSIGGSAFSGCYSLASITIPDSVTSIGGSAFYNCYSLASITIPDGVTSIGSSAFQGCYSLASITIPDSVTSIGGSAFSGCYGIHYYDFTRHTAVPTLSSTNAFSNIAADCEILVPAALAEEWKAATNWSTYADYIVGV